MSEIGRLATQIVENELPYLTGTDQSLAISRASGWLLNNIGQLNNRIFTSYSGENPGFKQEESAIYQAIYLVSYNKSKANSVLKNMDSDNLQWLSLREGDSQIQLQNKNEVAKTYLSISKQTQEEMDGLIWAYNLYQAYPRTVDCAYDEVGPSGNIIYDVDEYDENGFVDIPIGANSVAIAIGLNNLPTKINLSLIKPSGSSQNISYSVVGTSISSAGFVVGLGATISESGYRINYGVK